MKKLIALILGLPLLLTGCTSKNVEVENPAPALKSLPSVLPSAPLNGSSGSKDEPAKQEEINETKELISTTLKEGSGEGAEKGDYLTMHYVGTLADGTKFDSSRDRGKPFNFQLGGGQVIKGWDEGIVGMKIGELRRLVIPADMAYGDNAMGSIPAGSTLIFEVELLKNEIPSFIKQ